MNLISTLIAQWRAKRREQRIKQAFAIIEAEGLSVCNIQQRGGSTYLVDGKGGWHKVGKR